MAIDWQSFVRWFQNVHNVILVTHMRPDGDGIGSQLALAEALRAMQKKVRVVIPTSFPARYRFLDPEQEVIVYTPHGEELKDADGIMVMDTGTWNQLGKFGDFMKTMQVPKLVLDHHLTQDDLGALRLVDATAEATGRLTYEAIRALQQPISPRMATCLFTALAMDTGWFRHSNTTDRSFQLAAELVKAGVQPEKLYRELFENNTLGRHKLTGRILDRTTVIANGLVAYTYILLSDYTQTGAVPPDSEDLVNWTLSLQGVTIGLLFIEQPAGGTKISFRSKAGLNVGRLAERFGGGGHAAAAGAIVQAPLNEVRDQVLTDVLRAMDPERQVETESDKARARVD